MNDYLFDFLFALWPIGRLSVLPYVFNNYADNIQYFSLKYFFAKVVLLKKLKMRIGDRIGDRIRNGCQ